MDTTAKYLDTYVVPLAQGGAAEFMLMSVMWWTNPSQAKVYTEKARRKSMAQKAMDMLDDEEQK